MEFCQASMMKLLWKRMWGVFCWLGYVDDLLQVWRVVGSVCSLRNWSYSKEWVWNLGTKLCRTFPGK